MQNMKEKLTLAAYLIVLLLAIIFILVGINLADTPQDILINLGSEFAGVFLIFLLINRLLGLESNNDVIEQLDEISNYSGSAYLS
jgi:ABC-type multidrug transport system fused ATPase/permease subunit